MLYENILPGYFLVKGTVEVKDEWPKGWYGLVQCNDPDFIWEEKMTPDPLYGMTDEKFNDCSEKTWEKSKKWMKILGSIEEDFREYQADPMTSYQFVSACIKAGYKPKRDGFNVMSWFVNYVGQKMKQKNKKREPSND
jgi:hypothetical protein